MLDKIGLAGGPRWILELVQAPSRGREVSATTVTRAANAGMSLTPMWGFLSWRGLANMIRGQAGGCSDWKIGSSVLLVAMRGGWDVCVADSQVTSLKKIGIRPGWVMRPWALEEQGRTSVKASAAAL